MGEVGLQRWQLPFLKQLAAEIFQTGALRAAADSYCNHWLTHVASADDREELEALIPDGDDTEEEEVEVVVVDVDDSSAFVVFAFVVVVAVVVVAPAWGVVVFKFRRRRCRPS